MSQNYQNVPKVCDLSVKIAPDLTGHNFVKKYGVLGEIVKIYGVFG